MDTASSAHLQVDRRAGAFRCTITVARPMEDVYAVISDVEAWPRWLPTVTSVLRADVGHGGRDGSGGPAGPPAAPRPHGSFRVKQPKLPMALWRVSAVDAPRSFTWINRRGGVTLIAGHRIEPAASGGGVLVTLTIDQQGPLRRLVTPFTASLTGRYLLTEAEALKRRCEDRAAPA